MKGKLVLRKAEQADLSGIMAVENAAFMPGIREKAEVFAERAEIFSDGFFVLTEPDKIRKPGTDKVAGYFCAEIWNMEPFGEFSAGKEFDARFFELGHSIKARHCRTGNTLYISSFALLPEYCGKGTGSSFFMDALNRILLENPAIEQCILVVNEEWTAARRIYAKSGFETAGILDGFFGPSGQSGIIMTAAKEKIR